jgi:hypothetical protein
MSRKSDSVAANHIAKLFTTVYSSALAATSPEQFNVLRSNMEQQRPHARSPLVTAIMA